MWYATHGFAVMPLHSVDTVGACSCGNRACESVGKHPRTSNGLLDATTEIGKVRDFWERWPTANIGIATGPSGLVVIDVDPKNGGDVSFESLRAELAPETFGTVTALTGGGGEHYYFRDEGARFRNSASLIAPGIDVRAVGGYVVAPPSVHESGRKYAWEESSRINELEIKALPDAIAARLVKPSTSRIPIGGEPPGPELKIKQGSRDNALTSIAGTLRRKGFEADEIFALLVSTNRKRCEPPLPEADVKRIAWSVARYKPETTLEVFETQEASGTKVLVPEKAGFAVMRSWLAPPELREFSTGIPELDRVLRNLRPGEMTLLGAWTGIGKSGFSEQLGLHIAKESKVLFLPLELGVERTERRMLAKIMRTSEAHVESLERSDLREHKLEIYHAMEEFQDRKLQMLAPKNGEAIYYRQIEALIREQMPDVVFLDHLQHIEDWTPSDAKRSDLTAAAMVRRLRALCSELSVHIVCVHQLKGQKISKGQRPQIYDFADTSALPRVADTVLALHRPFRGTKGKDKIMEILVLKNRRGPEPWVHTHFEGSHIAMYPMDQMEAAMAECCSVKTPVAH
jgi:hypothetical protein